jgi:1-deoxy-D-xylulose-5-phosphate reductoisomerase
VAVAAFLGGRLPFTAIPRVIEATLNAVSGSASLSVESIMEADALARRAASERIQMAHAA